MANQAKQVYGTAQTCINSSVNVTAGNFSGTPLATFDNTTDTAAPYAPWGKATLVIGQTPSAPVVGTGWELWGILKDVLSTDDDTDAPASTVVGGARYFGFFAAAGSTTLQRRTINISLLGVEKLDPYIKNGTAQQITSTTTNLFLSITPFTEMPST